MKKKLDKNFIDDQMGYIESSDLGCSAALMSVGFELMKLEKESAHKAIFVFRDQEGIEENINNYFSDKLPVNARTFFDNIKNLKNLIFNKLK